MSKPPSRDNQQGNFLFAGLIDQLNPNNHCFSWQNKSTGLHQEKISEDEMCIDATVQEKNIPFPTDAKQYQKTHHHLLKIARAEHIALTRTYEKEVKCLKLCTHFSGHSKNRKHARKGS